MLVSGAMRPEVKIQDTFYSPSRKSVIPASPWRRFNAPQIELFMNPSSNAERQSNLAAVIRNRQTFKVLAPVESPVQFPEKVIAHGQQRVMDAISVAGWAPFHFDRSHEGLAEPWRVHVLWHDRCRSLAGEFHNLFSDVKATNKLPSMLSACGALVIVNWLPQFVTASDDSGAAVDTTNRAAVPKEKQRQIDEEHLAATSAFVQNLLLLLTDAGLGTYWSSGGQFRTAAAFEHLEIQTQERLLAAVFVDFDIAKTDVQRLPGKLREGRAAAERWTRCV